MIELFHFLGQVFMQIFNVSLTAGWFALAVVLIRFLLKKAPKWISCVLWGMVAIRLIMPFSIESALSLVPSAEPLPVTNIYKSGPDISGNLIYRNVNSGSQIFDVVIGSAMRETNSISVLKDNFSLLACIWIIGMLAMMIYTVVSCIKISKRLNEAMPLRDNVWICDRIDSPFIFGLVKPRIFLPSNMSEDDMKFVIAHEKAHLKRRDHWWKPLGFMLLTVYWFNPVLWIAYILLCRDIELACDEKVIKEMGAEIKKDYSNALINCSVPRKSIAACPLAFGETGVKSRIKSVLNYKKPALWIIVAAVVASIVLAVCFLTNPIEKKEIFNSKYETGECLYSYVVLEDKETRMNDLIFGINSTGGVYKDYGNGEGEYIGELKESAFTVKEMNYLLNSQDEDSIYLGRVSKVYEIKDETNDENAIDYVFIEKKNGDIVLVNFFSNGNIMNVFELNRVKRFNDETVSKKNDNLDDDLSQFIGLCIADHYNSERAEFLCFSKKVIGKKKFFNKTTVYLWVLAEGYNSDSNNGVTLEHGASVPTVITVEKEAEGFMSKGNGGYKLVEYWEPRDGSYYAKDIRSKFPWYMHNKVFGSQDYIDELSESIQRDVMEYYGIDYVAFESIEDYNEKVFEKNLTLSDVIILSNKKDELEWADFEEFRYVETGSGLYIRQYNIDEMFTLSIGGSGPDSEPMYFYLCASDAMDEKIDIRESDVEEFIRKHETNPVVKKLSAGWYTVPVGYLTTSKINEIFGTSKNSIINRVESLPVLKIDNKAELRSFIENTDGILNFEASYPDTESFSDIVKYYDEDFFESSSLILVCATAPTTAHRYTVEHVFKSEGMLSVGISEINPDVGDTLVQDWLISINVSKEAVSDINRIDAYISSVQHPSQETANENITRVYKFTASTEPIKPTVTLYDNGMFQFTFSAFSSYIGTGNYSLKNNVLILNTNDGKYTYVFDVDNNKLVFDAENSSDMLGFSDIKDGSVFE